MKKKSLLLGSISIILLVFISCIGYLVTYVEPKIIIKAEITPITDEAYDRIKQRSEPFIETATKNDFRSFNIELKYTEPFLLISNRSIEFNTIFTPSFIKESGVLNLSGGRGEQDNPNDSEVEYMESAEVYLNGKSVNDFRNLFDNYKIKISWDKFGTGREERIIYLKDVIVVK